jgi:hypothetical protein
MEATDLVFMANGVGWCVWSNALGGEQMLFRWSAQDQRLVISGQLYARLDYRHDRAVVTDEHDWDEEINAGYRIGPGHDAGGIGVTVLELDRRISRADRFALKRGELRSEDDPAGWTLR